MPGKKEIPLWPLVDSDNPEWKHILELFARYNHPAPPIRLRDELSCIMAWARYGDYSAFKERLRTNVIDNAGKEK